MKKLGLLIAAIVLGVACQGGVRPTSLVASQTVVQDKEPTKDLGEGFQLRVRKEAEGTVILIHFPEDSYWTTEATFPKFQDAVHSALIKAFECKSFKGCQPVLQAGAGYSVYVQLEDGRAFEIAALYETGDHTGPIVGIALIPIARA